MSKEETFLPGFGQFQTGPIRRFEVDGFRNFGKKAGINIKQLNVIVGPNGAGKSTLLSLFQLFDKSIRTHEIHEFSLADLDEYNLITPKQKPFKVRLYFDAGVFTYEYVVLENNTWIRKSLAFYSHKHPNKALISFMPNQIVRVGQNQLLEWLFSAPSITQTYDGQRQIDRKHIELSLKLLDCLTYVNFKWGELDRVSYDSGAQCTLNPPSSYWDQAVFRWSNSNHWHQFMAALYSLDNSNWAFEDFKRTFLNNKHYDECNKFELNYSSCRPEVQAEYAALESFRNAFERNPKEWSSQGFTKGPFSNFLILSGIAEVENRLKQNEISLVRRVIDSSLNGQRSENSFLMDFRSAHRALEHLIETLFAGSSTPEYGLVGSRFIRMNKPDDYIKSEQYKEEIREVKTTRHFEFIKTASADNITDALTLNKPLRRELLNYLRYNKKLHLTLQDFGLSCIIALNLYGGIEVISSKHNKNVSLKNLSRGENRLLVISLFKEFFAYLEEPETHLHPSYEAKLGTLVSCEYVSRIVMSNHNLLWDEERGILRFPGEQQDPRLNAIWVPEALRQFLFVETHSDILLKAIQLQMVKELPKKELWIENPSLTPTFEDFEKQFSDLDPNIEVTYFGVENGKWVPRSMGLRRDGVFRESFGPGFYDMSLELVRNIVDAQRLN